MKAFTHTHSKRAPAFHFLPEKEEFRIEGALLGKAHDDLQTKLVAWMKDYRQAPLQHTRLHVKLSALDRDGMEFIYSFLRQLEDLNREPITTVKVVWYCPTDALELESMGSRLGKALKYPFEVVKVVPGSNRVMGRYLILKAETDNIDETEGLSQENELADLNADDYKIMTAISDRLQRKLNQANEKLQAQSLEIKRINHDLEDRNHKLEETIDALTKAKVSKKATTIVLVIAVVLFMVSEGIEEYIEWRMEGVLEFYWVFLIKLVLALCLKPIESFVERRILRKTAENKTAQQEKELQRTP